MPHPHESREHIFGLFEFPHSAASLKHDTMQLDLTGREVMGLLQRSCQLLAVLDVSICQDDKVGCLVSSKRFWEKSVDLPHRRSAGVQPHWLLLSKSPNTPYIAGRLKNPRCSSGKLANTQHTTRKVGHLLRQLTAHTIELGKEIAIHRPGGVDEHGKQVTL